MSCYKSDFSNKSLPYVFINGIDDYHCKIPNVADNDPPPGRLLHNKINASGNIDPDLYRLEAVASPLIILLQK